MTPPRTIDATKRRTVNRSVQTPVIVPSEYPLPEPPATPLHRIETETLRRLRQKRRDERKGKEVEA